MGKLEKPPKISIFGVFSPWEYSCQSFSTISTQLPASLDSSVALGGRSSLLKPPLQVAVYLTGMCWIELECWSVQRSQVVNQCFSIYSQAVSTRCRTKRGLWLVVRKSGRVSRELTCSPVVAFCLRMKSQSSLQSPFSPSGNSNCSSTAWSRLHGCRVEGCISLAIRQECVGDQAHLNQPLVVSTEDLSPQQPCQLWWMFVHMWLFLITLLQICTGRGIHFQYKLPIWLLIFDPGSEQIYLPDLSISAAIIQYGE